MRWPTHRPPLPKGGDTRDRRIFAWRPKDISGTTVWLELYGITEQFFQPRSGAPGWWSVQKTYPIDYYC